jgi:RNA polymerase sigma factor (sigma-70 family)
MMQEVRTNEQGGFRIMEKMDLEALGKPLRDWKAEYDMLVEPHRPALWRYCRAITGSPWEAEDLVQETLLKAFAVLPQLWQPLVTKSYLFRIASNAWIDQCRKRRIPLDPLPDVEELSSEEKVDSVEVREAIELLVTCLPPRQAMIFMLMDVFQFTSRETAGMVGMTEGAVKAALHRARAKLKALQEKQEKEPAKGAGMTMLPESHKRVIEAYLEAFNRRDPQAIAALLDEQACVDIVHIAQEHGREYIEKYSLAEWAKDPHRMRAECHLLWGRPVVAVMTDAPEGEALYDLICLDVEQGRIVRKQDYYFCQDLLMAAAKELGIPAHPNGYRYVSN